MIFIEIDGIVINADQIVSVAQERSKYDPNLDFSTKISLSDGQAISCGSIYYMKLKNILKPIHLEDERQTKL